MKVKVKGLVFAGLAAVIFAGNAMAAVDTTPQPGDLDNTTNLNYVTSKKYVDRVVTNATANVAGKVNTNQGVDNVNKYLQVNASGNLELQSMDQAPTESSNKAVTSGAVYTALAGKQDNLTVDTEPTSGSAAFVTSGTVYTALAGKQDKSDSTVANGTYNYIHQGSGVATNLIDLDTQVKTNADAIADNASAITTLQGQAANISDKQDKTDSVVSSSAAGSAATGGLLTAGQGVGANLVSVATQATTNKTDIATINSSAVMTSGIDSTKVAQIATNASNITNLQTESATHQLISNKATDVTTVAAADKDTKYPTVGAVQAPSSCNSNAPCAWINNAWVPIQQ